MEKIIPRFQKITIAVIICLIAVITVLSGRCIPSAFADTDIVTAYEYTNVYDDLVGSTIGGKPFDVADFPHDEKGSPQIISFIEFGYSYYSNKQDDYGLYIYVYNPQDIAFDLKVRNAINMTYGDIDDYINYPLSFLNYSKQKGYEGRFYKFRIELTSAQKRGMLKDLNSDSRTYQVVGFQLSYKNKLTDYECAQKYTYSGFALGYGSELAESDTLSCKVDGFDRYLTLDVRSTVWRSTSSSKGKDYSNQLNSVYFSVPDKYFDEYGRLQEIKAEWWEYQTDWVVVTTSTTLYNYMKKNMGRKYFTLNESGKHVNNFDSDAPYGLFGWDCITPSTSDSSSNGRYTYGYSLDRMKSGVASWVKNDSAAFYYAFFTDKSITKANVHSKTLTDWIYTYKDKYSVTGFLDCKNANTIPAELFTNIVDSGRKRGHQVVKVDANDSYGLLSYGDKHGFWDSVSDFGFWNTVLGKVPTDKSIQISEPIMPLKKNLYDDLEKSVYSKMFYIGSDDVDEFDEYIHKSWNKKETPVLFRFAVTDYYRAYGNALGRDGSSYASYKKTLYGAKETVFLDFDIIQLKFRKDNVDTVVPVVASPIDVIGGITPPPVYGISGKGFDILFWLKLILGIIFGVIILVVLIRIGALSLIGEFFAWFWKIITAPFKAIFAAIKKSKSKDKDNGVKHAPQIVQAEHKESPTINVTVVTSDILRRKRRKGGNYYDRQKIG